MTERPSLAEIEAARDKTVPDVIAPGLKVLFCGFNPGLYSGATGHHFSRPGNRFWPTLQRSGFTPRQLAPAEERELLDFELGITNIVERSTARASELDDAELRAGGARLIRKLRRFKPRVLAVLGVTAFRVAFGDPKAKVGPQTDTLAGTEVWVLPNPSGLNAHYQIDDLVREYRALRHAVNRVN